jgi:hypothetical protein
MYISNQSEQSTLENKMRTQKSQGCHQSSNRSDHRTGHNEIHRQVTGRCLFHLAFTDGGDGFNYMAEMNLRQLGPC